MFLYNERKRKRRGKQLRNKNFKLFLLLEALLLLLTIFLLIKNWDLLFVLLAGAFLVKIGLHKNKKNSILFWVGWFMITFTLLSVFSVWFMIILFLAYLIMNGDQLFSDLNLGSLVEFPWKKKHYVGVEVEEPENHSGKRKKQKWIGNSTTGTSIFEWNDINLSVFMGDTIIDLGNTLLPNGENIILVRKGFGQTRIIVPAGVGVSLQQSAIQGSVIFNHEYYPLSNETFTIYSKDYATATRRVKIVSNTLFGDFEVIYL